MGNFCFTCVNPLTEVKGENIYEGSPGFPNGDIFPANHNSIAPRFNFSWAPSALRNTVIRGGYDIFYTDAIENFNAPGQSAANGSAWGWWELEQEFLLPVCCIWRPLCGLSPERHHY